MIGYNDIKSRYPWCTLIAYHTDGDYHYAVWLSGSYMMFLHMPYSALSIQTHIVYIYGTDLSSLHRWLYIPLSIQEQLTLYIKYYDVIASSSFEPCIVKDPLRWSALSQSFGVSEARTVLYLGPAAFANGQGNIDWSCSYQLLWS